MRLHFTLVAVSTLATLVTGVAVDNDPFRLAQNTQTLQIGEHTITTATVPLSQARIKTFRNNASSVSPVPVTLGKRALINACPIGFNIQLCQNPTPTAPAAADCTNLANALLALDTQTAANSPAPCNTPRNSNCPNFVVQPTFEQIFTLGTCLVGFANLNAPGGDDFSYCDFLLAGVTNSLFQLCVRTHGNTGGQTFPATNNFGAEVGHA